MLCSLVPKQGPVPGQRGARATLTGDNEGCGAGRDPWQRCCSLEGNPGKECGERDKANSVPCGEVGEGKQQRWKARPTVGQQVRRMGEAVNESRGGIGGLLLGLGVSKEAGNLPWLVWFSGLRAKGSPVRCPVRAPAWIWGQVPSRGRMRSNHTRMFPRSLPSPLSKNK